MKKRRAPAFFTRKLMNLRVHSLLVSLSAVAIGFAVSLQALAQTDPLPSWNDGRAKQAIVEFVHTTTDQASARFVPPEARIATFDQDGTLWVEHPMYTQVVYCLDRVPAVVKEKPELAKVEPFKTVLVGRPRGDREALDRRSRQDPRRHAHRHECRRVQSRGEEVARHRQGPALEAALHRAHLPADDRVAEVPARATVTRPTSSPAAARISCGCTPRRCTAFRPSRWSAPPAARSYGYDKNGRPFLTKEPKLLLNDNNAGKPEGIHLMIGRRPYAAFGNSTGDRQMLEYTKAGDGARLAMLVLHDDATARVRLWSGARTARHQGRHLHPGAVRRGRSKRAGSSSA